MPKEKGFVKGQTMIYKTTQRKLKIKQYKPKSYINNPMVELGGPTNN